MDNTARTNPQSEPPAVPNRLDSVYLHIFFYILLIILYGLLVMQSHIGKPIRGWLVSYISAAGENGLGFAPLLVLLITILLTFLIRFGSLMCFIIAAFWKRFRMISHLDRLGAIAGITTACVSIIWCVTAENPYEPLAFVFGGITLWIKTTTNFFEKDLTPEGERNND